MSGSFVQLNQNIISHPFVPKIKNLPIDKMAIEIMEIPLEFKKYKPNYKTDKTDNTSNIQDAKKIISVVIPRNSDSCKLLYFIICSKEITSIQALKKVMENCELEITIGGCPVIKYYFDILMELEQVKKYENEYVIMIPSDFTVNEIFLIALQWHDVRININLENIELIDDMQLYCEGKFMEEQKRNCIVNTSQEHMFQEIELLVDHSWSSNKLSETQYNFIPAGMVKGYFIQGDLSKIKQLTLKYDNVIRLTYDNIQLGVLCHKISDKLHYLSFTNKNNYKELSLESYIGASCAAKVNVASFILKLSPTYKNNDADTIDTIKIYSMSFYLMRYIGGMGGSYYDLEFGKGKQKAYIVSQTFYDDIKTILNENILDENTFIIPQTLCI